MHAASQSRAENRVLAVDLGTSGPKVGLVSGVGQVLDCEFEPTPLLLLPGGDAEQQPEARDGLAPVYSMAATLPMRSIVGGLLRYYIDLLYRPLLAYN